MTTFAELLSETGLGPSQRRRVAHALSSACCVPRDPTLRAQAQRHVDSLDVEMAPGEAVLVSTRAHGGAELHRLVPAGPVDPRERPAPRWDAVAEHALRVAVKESLRLTYGLRLLRVQGDDLEHERAAWEPEFLIGSTSDAAVQCCGASYGLAMASAAVSRVLDWPLPSDAICLAALDDDGRAREVEGLEAKLSAVRGYALGVSRVLVAPAQIDEARAFAGDLEIVACEDVGEALRVLWGANWRVDAERRGREDVAWLTTLDDAALTAESARRRSSLEQTRAVRLHEEAVYVNRVLPLERARLRRRAARDATLDLLFVTVGDQPWTPSLAVEATRAAHTVLLHTDEMAEVSARVTQLFEGERSVEAISIGPSDPAAAARGVYARVSEVLARHPNAGALGFDLTGGLKPMSASLAMAAVRHGGRVFYVDGDQVRGFLMEQRRWEIDPPGV